MIYDHDIKIRSLLKRSYAILQQNFIFFNYKNFLTISKIKNRNCRYLFVYYN
jgi:hypothetical protein